jgi:restriction endonuclease S subunit
LLPLPPSKKAIADYLDTQITQIDQIINIQIETLKERCKTLINNVVIGIIKTIESL